MYSPPLNRYLQFPSSLVLRNKSWPVCPPSLYKDLGPETFERPVSFACCWKVIRQSQSECCWQKINKLSVTRFTTLSSQANLHSLSPSGIKMSIKRPLLGGGLILIIERGWERDCSELVAGLQCQPAAADLETRTQPPPSELFVTRLGIPLPLDDSLWMKLIRFLPDLDQWTWLTGDYCTDTNYSDYCWRVMRALIRLLMLTSAHSPQTYKNWDFLPI